MKNVRKQKLIAASTLSAMLLAKTGGLMGMGVAVGASASKTPIQHAIIIVGENRTFDHLFGTYVPPKGQTVENLLSEGIEPELQS
jgi:phospholipase C